MQNTELHRISGSLRLGRTDAAGVLYFASAFELAHEAIESYLESCGCGLKSLLKSGPYLPIVHAEADFKSPVRTGDHFYTAIESLDCSARSLAFSIKLSTANDQTIATLKIIHACIDPATGKAIDIPDSLRTAISQAK
ncbi:MAG: thioesterase family protein [Planctomycetota bacterium]|nr:thioesterase family protein [Planctomycetota bacterium]MDA1262594.1 thioesterase family protein [Planctomycetota bacterium]